MNLTNQAGANLRFRNLKMPTSWSGSVQSATPSGYLEVAGQGLDYLPHVNMLSRKQQFGTVVQETTIVRTGGAVDQAGNAISWKLVSTSSAGTFPITFLRGPEIVIRNEQINCPRTLTVRFLHDSLTGLNNDEIWVEAMYYGDAAAPDSVRVCSCKQSVLASGTTCDSSIATWVTTGLTNPNAQKILLTLPNVRLAGYVKISVYLCKASYTVYVDPKIELS